MSGAGRRRSISSHNRVAVCVTIRRSMLRAGVRKQAECSAGAANGTYDLAQCISEDTGQAAVNPGRSSRHRAASGSSPGGASRRQGVPRFSERRQSEDVRLALRRLRVDRHVKRYTTTGMATDQGKTSEHECAALVAETLDRPLSAIGTTTFRPPYNPSTFGVLAGAATACNSILCAGRRSTDGPRRGRRVRECRDVAARLVLSRAGESMQESGQPRVPRGARRCRPLRCLDARQDRGRGADAPSSQPRPT
jgi:hypothetical protein